MDDPCTKKIVPRGVVPAFGFLFQRKSFTSPFVVQCSVPPVHCVVDCCAAIEVFSNAERCSGNFRGQCKLEPSRHFSLPVNKPFPHGVVNGADSVTEVVLRSMSRTP